MEAITLDDLELVNDLSARPYVGNKLRSNVTKLEYDHFFLVKKKLKQIAKYYSAKYDSAYGPFRTSISSGNPIAVGGTELNNVWSGIYKGASNKQYAAQVSFVINRDKPCLNVGFYFGAASGHSLNKSQRNIFEKQLKDLGVSLSYAIQKYPSFRSRYNALFDFGFNTFTKGQGTSAKKWCSNVSVDPKDSQIFARIYPNEFGIIENSTIDSFISQIIFLMGAIRNVRYNKKPIKLKPLTPEQRAKQAERLAEIGQKGETFVFESEQKRLKLLGVSSKKYPKHVALDSMNDGFDILSLNDKVKEIFIEVKTTTRKHTDSASKKFSMSTNEYKKFLKNKKKYFIYRVYDIENYPTMDIIDLNKISPVPNGYLIKY